MGLAGFPCVGLFCYKNHLEKVGGEKKKKEKVGGIAEDLKPGEPLPPPPPSRSRVLVTWLATHLLAGDPEPWAEDSYPQQSL